MARFWDTSAIIPLLVNEPVTPALLALLHDDEHMTVWWGTRIECASALSRRIREGGFDSVSETRARALVDELAATWSEVLPTNRVRSNAQRLLAVHPLRAADAVQLASALVWAGDTPEQRPFVCLDRQLGQAARKEGFVVLPPG